MGVRYLDEWPASEWIRIATPDVDSSGRPVSSPTLSKAGFDPSQPRDEDGQWTDGAKKVVKRAPAEFLKAINKDLYDIIKDARPDMSEEEIQSTIDRISGESHKEPTQYFTVDLENGTELRVVNHSPSEINEELLERAGQELARIIDKDPKNDGKDFLLIFSDEIGFNADELTAASTRVGGTDIRTTPNLFRDFSSSHLMPAAVGRVWQYVLAHEYGHARMRKQHSPELSAVAVGVMMSRYGRTNDAEAYAEAYAQWVFDKDSVTDEIRELAKAEEWPDA